MRTDLATFARPTRRAVGYRVGWVQSLTGGGPIDVSVCVANWNCRELLRACLESLQDRPQGVRLEVIVVDNASSDGAADMVARDFPEVVLVRNADNRGFSRANNQAAAKARGRYLFFLNNDTEVPAFTLRRLVTFADRTPNLGLLGPRLRDPRGRQQISYRRLPTALALLHRTLLFRWTGLLRTRYRDYRRESFAPDALQRVEALMGAAVLVPRRVFAECGGWDEGYAFGVEDIDLSLRVGRKHEVVYFPRAEVVHYGRVGSRSNVAFTEPNLAAGYARYLRQSGASLAVRIGYKLAVTLDAPVQLAARSVQWAWRRLRGRADKAARSARAVRGLWAFLSAGLARFWRA